MKLHRLATSVAATSALVLTGAVPAIAEHGDPEPILSVDQNLRFCEDLIDLPGLEDFQDALNDHIEWNTNNGENTKTPREVVQHDWWDVTFGDLDGENNALVNIENVADGQQLLVIVKGGSGNTGDPHASNVFINEPGQDLIGLYAPTVASGKHPTISHYSVCKLGKVDIPPPPPTPTPTPTPTDEPTEEPEETTPAAVPTEIPAGTGNAGAGSAGTAGLIAMLAAFAAGAAVIIRRRFLTES